MPSPYQVLGLKRTATAAEVKARYRKLAAKYHPDRCKLPDAAARFRSVREAYKALTAQPINGPARPAQATRPGQPGAGFVFTGRATTPQEQAELRAALETAFKHLFKNALGFDPSDLIADLKGRSAR